MSKKLGLLVLVMGSLLLAPTFFMDAEGSQTPGWGIAQQIETDNEGTASYPQVAIDPSGNTIAVWRQSDGTRYNIWANRFTAGTGWGTAQLIETDNSGEALGPQVAVDPSGNAIAVWYQSDGTRNNIWANRYTAGTGWGTAQLIETDNSGSAFDPQVAIDPSGNAIAVWYQYDGTRFNIWANRFTPGTGWGTALLIETDNSGEALGPQVAIDPSGNAIAVWHQYDGTRNNIWANRFTPGTGWGTAQLIETDNSGEALGPQVAVDPSGNAIAVWHQYDGTRYNIWANRFTAGTGWGTAQLIETDNSGEALGPQVAVDPSGNAIAVWYQYDGTRYTIWANRFTPGTGWGTAQLIETNNSGGAYSSQVAIDPSGNAIAVWHQYDGTRNNIWANRFTPGTGWGTAQLIETDNSGFAFNPQVAIDPSGNAIAVWYQSDGTRYNIWANRYIMPDTTPPSLHISSPINGMGTDINTVVVNGITEPGASVSINGIAAYVEKNGSFSVMIPLKRGENTITVKASDPSGNTNSTSFIVVYSDPVLSELSSLQTSFSSLEVAISELEDMLNALDDRMNNLDLSYSDNISYLKEEMEKLKEELDRTKENLTMLNDTLAGLGEEVNLSSMVTSIDSLENDLKGLQTDVGDMEANVERLEGDISSIGSEVDEIKGSEGSGLEDDVKDLKRTMNILWAVLVVMVIFVLFLFLILIVMMGIVMMGKRKKDRIEE